MLHQLSYKIREQISIFSGKLSANLSKPKRGFVDEMMYGLTVSQSVMLSEISRALNEEIALIKTENRLCRNLGDASLGIELQRTLSAQMSTHIQQDSLLVLDLSDISKKYAQKMEYIARVRDGSEGEIANGYWTCQVLGVEGDQLIPLYGQLYSAESPGFRSENHEIFKAITFVTHACQKRGIWVIDRGGDRGKLFRFFLRNNLRFIVRLQQQRHLLVGPKSTHELDLPSLAASCPIQETQKIIRQRNGKDELLTLEYGQRVVRLPKHPHYKLWLIVVHGYGEKPLMLLTNQRKKPREILQDYLSRWRIEDTIRFAKQTFDIENIRLLTYQRLQNMYVLINAALAFNMSWLSIKTKLKIIFTKALSATKTLFGVPDFHYYLLANGISSIFQRVPAPRKLPTYRPPPNQPSLF